jgi:ribA/ribD-fused uncharacterized protein
MTAAALYNPNTPPILRFDGTKHEFLSNFHSSTVWFDGQDYETVEHAYQAAKTLSEIERRAICFAETPGKAKRLGNKVTLRSDWEIVKPLVMLQLLAQKFMIPDLRSRLLATVDAYLEEGNTWNDVYWGVCNGVGQNMLGKQLMYIRSLLR